MSDANEMLLEDIIRKKMFQHVFQPLYVMKNWKVFGYEALLRCRFFENPELLFRLAMEKNRLYDLDICSIHHALTSVDTRDIRLFLNVYPSTMVHPTFPDFLGKLNSVCFSNRNIVFEINEAEKVSDMGLLRKAVHFLKDKGYAIALDDYGKGESSLQTVIELEPDFVKLDRYYAVKLSASKNKQNEIQMLLKLCQEKHMKLILEGIEEPTDLAMAKVLGVHLGQGYLLGEPLPINGIH
ncbi:EAL domain-containing protein [Aneurinibacillus terranovensis]|uniref:EAL domain-containing protein n=1 Tax=Aneurinibacillus terranovensis TaxID=278991 RepID=UPI0004111078|nr:EAL domain-containing protein [Aneurinibacillus terranovensis]